MDVSWILAQLGVTELGSVLGTWFASYQSSFFPPFLTTLAQGWCCHAGIVCVPADHLVCSLHGARAGPAACAAPKEVTVLNKANERKRYFPSTHSTHSMPPIRRSKKPPPEGWELIEPTLDELNAKMREGVCRLCCARSMLFVN